MVIVSTTAIPGSCLCGGVRFEVDPPFIRAGHCHCSRCRKHSGTFGLTQVRVERKQFRLQSGADLIRVFGKNQGAVKAFCSVCGSSLFGGTWPDGPQVSIRMGSFDADPGIRPQFHTYIGSRAAWDEIIDDLPQFHDAWTAGHPPLAEGVPDMPGTVRLHRVLRAKPEKVYRAFLDAGAMAKWLPPHGFVCKVHHLDARVGGGFKMSFENFSNGQTHSFGGTYRKLVPGEFIQYSDKFDDPNLAGEMLVSVTLKPVSCGTDLSVEQSGLPDVIPLEMCYLGWQESLSQLANLVEPEIAG